MHSVPNPILMPDGSEVTVVRQPDGQLTCPVVDCPLRLHPTRTGYIRHLQKHNLKPVTDRPGPAKRAAQPEHRSGSNKKAKVCITTTEVSGPLGPVFLGAPRDAEQPSNHADPTLPWSPPQPKGLRMSCFVAPAVSDVNLSPAARIQLDGSRSYLVTFEPLDRIGFVAHKALRVLMCRKCLFCFIPNDLMGHAQTCQGASQKSVSSEELWELVEGELFHLDVSSVILPSPRGPPVEGIKRVDGCACSVDPASCAYCCCNPKGMETHVRSHPNRPPRMSDCYRASVTLQTLFNKFGVTYFEVEPALANVSSGDPLAHILQKYLPIVPGDFMFLLSRHFPTSAR